MSGDLRQAEILKGVPADSLHDGSHDVPSPERLCQPVTDLGPVGLADLKPVKAAAANQRIRGVANGEMHGTALLLGDLGNQGQPFVGIFLGVREGNAESTLV